MPNDRLTVLILTVTPLHLLIKVSWFNFFVKFSTKLG